MNVCDQCFHGFHGECIGQGCSCECQIAGWRKCGCGTIITFNSHDRKDDSRYFTSCKKKNQEKGTSPK